MTLRKRPGLPEVELPLLCNEASGDSNPTGFSLVIISNDPSDGSVAFFRLWGCPVAWPLILTSCPTSPEASLAPWLHSSPFWFCFPLLLLSVITPHNVWLHILCKISYRMNKIIYLPIFLNIFFPLPLHSKLWGQALGLHPSGPKRVRHLVSTQESSIK